VNSGWRKLRAIVSGFKNYRFKNEYFENLAKERAKVCAACPEANPEHPFKLLLDDNVTVEPIKGMGCKICNCYLPAKVRQAFEGCPLKKWKE
jgi:hypothetical protein